MSLGMTSTVMASGPDADVLSEAVVRDGEGADGVSLLSKASCGEKHGEIPWKSSPRTPPAGRYRARPYRRSDENVGASPGEAM